jgi:alcohol dehydrogenase
MNSYNLYVPTQTLFGAGMLNRLHEQKLPGRKALLVISKGKSTRANGYLDRVEQELTAAGVTFELFDQVEANPLHSTVMAGARAAWEAKAEFIVALGGGSVIDASKGIAAMAMNDGDLWDYIRFGSGKGMTLKNDPLPLVVITTTAGTGSENDAGAVITHETLHEKTALGDPRLFPRLAIVDPELTLSVPPAYTAYQGFDALFHNLEAYVSLGANPMSDMYALTAVEAVAGNLAKAVKDGKDIEARSAVSFGNTLAGTVMSVGSCTSEHSLEHAMSAFHQSLPHGAGLIMISLAYYRRLVEGHACDDRLVRLAKAMGMKSAKRPEDFLKALAKLQKACGVDQLKMSDYGIAKDEFPKFAKNARETMGWLFNADRVPYTQDVCERIYAESYR